MTKLTRDTLVLLIAQAFDPVAFSSGVKQADDGSRDYDRQTSAMLRAHTALTAILAHARIVPLEVTDEMIQAALASFDGQSEHAYLFDGINAAIEEERVK